MKNQTPMDEAVEAWVTRMLILSTPSGPEALVCGATEMVKILKSPAETTDFAHKLILLRLFITAAAEGGDMPYSDDAIDGIETALACLGMASVIVERKKKEIRHGS